MRTVAVTTDFVIEACCNCGIEFGMSKSFFEAKKEDKTEFYCPRGHRQHYIESASEVLQEQLDHERSNREWTEKELERSQKRRELLRRQLSAARGFITKLRRRIVCTSN